MKTIKINFTNFWGSFNKEDNLFYNILKKHFNVEISDEPDFVICSNRGKPFEYMKYDCVRIMFIGEPFSCDFTSFDYIIGHDYLEFGDRHFRLPYAFYSESGNPWSPKDISKSKAKEIMSQKKYFANFIYSHPSAEEIREQIFKRMNEYKRVEAAGRLLNNTQTEKNFQRISYAERSDYITGSKFTIAAENVAYPGYVTEKIVDPYIYYSIPIYYGNPLIEREFNTDSMVLMNSISDLENVMKEIEYLDTHDDAYIEKLMICPLNDRFYLEKKYAELEEYLVSIFSQKPEEAYRRVRQFCAREYEENLKRAAVYLGKDSVIDRTKSFIKKIIK